MDLARGSTLTDDPGVQWLLDSQNPSVRFLTLTDVLGKTSRAREVREAKEAITRGPWVRALLKGQQSDGGFGNDPYAKWTGAHWRLISLVELGLPAGHGPAMKASDVVLRWLRPGEGDSTRAGMVDGLVLRHASIDGNAIASCVGLGRAKDPAVAQLVDRLLDSQWPDGGWNCDRSATGKVSSFYETLTPMWGLSAYARATDSSEAQAAAERAAEFFLERKVFRGRRNAKVINPRWLSLHYPLYWHYDILHGLLLLSRVVGLKDPRVNEALDIVESKIRPDGTWRAGGSYWRPSPSGDGKPNRHVSGSEVVDWGRRGQNLMITLNALRVLRAAGR